MVTSKAEFRSKSLVYWRSQHSFMRGLGFKSKSHYFSVVDPWPVTGKMGTPSIKLYNKSTFREVGMMGSPAFGGHGD